MNDKCPKCGCKEIVLLAVFRGDGSNSMACAKCGYNWFFPPLEVTVFQKITQSPEVLAEKLVYETAIRTSKLVYDHRGRGVGVRYDIEEVWKSTITEDTYTSKSEAHAATVAKLKEVANG